jgi:hypothetical protein
MTALLQQAPSEAGLTFPERMLAAEVLLQQLSDVIHSQPPAGLPLDFVRATVDALSAAAEAAANEEGDQQLAAANAAMVAAADSIVQDATAALTAAAQPPAPAAAAAAQDEPAAAAVAPGLAAVAGAVPAGGQPGGDNTFGGLQTPLAIVLAAMDAVRNRAEEAYDELNDVDQPLAANAALELAHEGYGVEGLLEDAIAGEVMLPLLATSAFVGCACPVVSSSGANHLSPLTCPGPNLYCRTLLAVRCSLPWRQCCSRRLRELASHSLRTCWLPEP